MASLEGLRSVTIADVMRAKEARRAGAPAPAVVQLEHSASLAHGLKVLAKHRILSAPLIMQPSLEDLGGEEGLAEDATTPALLGWVDINDILKALLSHVRKAHHGSIPSNMLLLMTSLESAGKPFNDRQLVTLSGGDDKSLVYETEGQAQLLETIRDNLLNNAGTGRVVHRLAIFDARGEVQHIISQLDIIRMLSAQPSLLGDLSGQTLEQVDLLPAGPGHVVCVDPHMPTLLALDRMVQAGVSGAAVVSAAGELVANLSTSDLRGIQPEHLGVLALPVAEFLALLHGTTYLGYAAKVSQQAEHAFFAASRSAAAPAGPGGHQDAVPLITCTRTSTLQQVLALMADNGVHRVYVLDPAAKPQVVAVVTPTDVLRLLVAKSGASAASSDTAQA